MRARLAALACRVTALHLPAESDSDFHIHAWLHVFVGARPVPVGYRPGAVARFGLDPEELHAAQPHLAVVHLDAWVIAGHERWSAALTPSCRPQRV